MAELTLNRTVEDSCSNYVVKWCLGSKCTNEAWYLYTQVDRKRL